MCGTNGTKDNLVVVSHSVIPDIDEILQLPVV